MSQPNLFQLSDYDITQQIIEVLSNICSRAILFSVLHQTKDATQISRELDLSSSNVYKTLSHLESLALVTVDRFIISKGGKKIKLYKSRIGRAEIILNGLKPELNLFPNNERTRQIS